MIVGPCGLSACRELDIPCREEILAPPPGGLPAGAATVTKKFHHVLFHLFFLTYINHTFWLEFKNYYNLY